MEHSGHIEIDDNAAERSLRGVALGRKNICGIGRGRPFPGPPNYGRRPIGVRPFALSGASDSTYPALCWTVIYEGNGLYEMAKPMLDAELQTQVNADEEGRQRSPLE
jgi:hypothetical protein